MMTEVPVPDGLGPSGERLWAEAMTEFRFDAAERALLFRAAQVEDQLDALNVALAAGPAIVEGSKGQPVAHPCLAEIRRHSETLAKLVASLKLPENIRKKSVSAINRDAASTRWARDARSS